MLNSQIVQGEIILWKTAVNGCIQSGNGVIADFTDRELGKEKIIPSEIGLPEISNQVTKKKIGRNDPCPCGSGKKYKHCCGK